MQRSHRLIWFLLGSLFLHVSAARAATPQDVRIMTWNIWHGGREDGESIGPKRVVDVIRASGADIVAMQETYGSGELVSSELGFHFHPRGTNVSIHSRYPVLEDISVGEEFKCVGGLIGLPGGQRLAFYSIWLSYNKEIWAEGTRDTSNPMDMLSACDASFEDLKTIWASVKERLSDPKYSDVPIVIAGDFNSMSALDYTEPNISQYKQAIDWPTSRVLLDEHFRDAYREANPKVDRMGDRTWTPRFPKQEQDRIDFVYFRGPSWAVRKAWIIDEHPEQFPSDHAAVVAVLSY